MSPLRGPRDKNGFVSIIIKFVVGQISTRRVQDRELHRKPMEIQFVLVCTNDRYSHFLQWRKMARWE